ncbi:MAG: HAD-IIIC family phosphatase [Phaeospirillum sp.]|nr:HAD-IIIC family phosphatase [Phaeospirillum sp.]
MTAQTGTIDWASVKACAAAGDAVGAFAMLGQLARPEDDFTTQRRHARLVQRLPRQGLGLQPLKVALLAQSTTDHFAEILGLWLALAGYDAEIHQPPFGQAVQSIINPASPLYDFGADVVWMFGTWRDVGLEVTPGADADAVADAVARAVEREASLWQALRQRSDALIVQNTADIPAVDVFSHFAANVAWSHRSLLHRYNLALADSLTPGVVLFDLDHVSACHGKSRWTDPRYWHHSKHAFAFDAIGLVAHQFTQLVLGAKGRARKCLVLDLDNTLWGGVIGDDGLDGIKLGNGAAGEAFVDFQAYIRRLKDRGIILAVCSKNEDANAREPFLKHPDMRLGIDDIAVFRANWDNKADNIKAIAEALNIGLDSLVFVDDNPAERALVRRFLPMVAVPEMPEDPSHYVETLQRAHLFETVSFSKEDGERNEYYRANASRQEIRGQFADLGAYQRSLEMIGRAAAIEAFTLPRSAQLINKSNQFHLTGTRYGEAEIGDLLAQDHWAGRCFTLRDRFGDNGLIAVVLLRRDGRTAHVDTWVMSCRVLGRGMEEFIVNDMMAMARTWGCTALEGRYVPSKKNALVARLYPRLGFAEAAGPTGETRWRLNLGTAAPLVTQITPDSGP